MTLLDLLGLILHELMLQTDLSIFGMHFGTQGGAQMDPRSVQNRKMSCRISRGDRLFDVSILVAAAWVPQASFQRTFFEDNFSTSSEVRTSMETSSSPSLRFIDFTPLAVLPNGLNSS